MTPELALKVLLVCVTPELALKVLLVGVAVVAVVVEQWLMV